MTALSPQRVQDYRLAVLDTEKTAAQAMPGTPGSKPPGDGLGEQTDKKRGKFSTKLWKVINFPKGLAILFGS